MSERVPEGWVATKLGTLGSFSKGKGISKSETISKGIPCLRYAEIYTSYDFVIKNFKSFIEPDTIKTTKKLFKNDIIFAGSGETVEDIGKSVAFISDHEAYVGGDTIILTPYPDLDSIFLSYQLNDEIRRKQLRKLGQGSSVIHIYSSGLEDMNLVLPPLPEQKKIASILTSVDEVIENTQKQIDKLQDLKKATMSELLTKGIGHTEFKDSELGRIPKSWEVNRFGEISRQKTLGTTERGGGGVMVPLIKMGDIQSGKVLNEANEKVSKSKLIAQNFLSNGDFLFNTRNTPELVGKVGNYNSNKIAAYDNNLLKIDFLEDVSSLFMGMQFNESTFKKRLKTLVAGTTSVAAIYWNDLSRFKVLKPNVAEQKEMTSIILSIEKQIDYQKSKLAQTQSLKKSLMQDLLTGKVRVQVN